jgi:hypothetical protein
MTKIGKICPNLITGMADYHKDVSQKEIYKKFRNIFSPNLSFAISGSFKGR